MSRGRLLVEVSSGTIFRVILIGLGFWFLYVIADILIMFFAALVLAAAIEPVARAGERARVPRAVTTAVVYALVLVVLSGAVTALVPPVVGQLRDLASAAPQLVAFISQLGVVPGVDERALTSSLQEVLLKVGDAVANASLNILSGTATIFSGIARTLFVFVLTFYLVLQRDALKKFIGLVTPKTHVPYAERMLDRVTSRIGRWVLAQLTLGLIVGILVAVGLSLIGVPYALVLAVLAGVLEIIPVLGPILAAIPGVVVGLAQSVWLGLATLVFYILVQQFENHVLVPNIMRRAVGLNPLVTIVAVLLGVRLAGLPGAIFAVPLATIISIFLSDFFAGEDRSDELVG